MLDYSVNDFHRPAAKRANREQLLRELSKAVEEDRTRSLHLGGLSRERILTEDSRDGFEMKSILVKDITAARHRIVEVYLLLPDKELKTYLSLLRDLREAELALIILEWKRLYDKKPSILDRAAQKVRKENLQRTAELEARAQEDIKNLNLQLEVLSQPGASGD